MCEQSDLNFSWTIPEFELDVPMTIIYISYDKVITHVAKKKRGRFDVTHTKERFQVQPPYVSVTDVRLTDRGHYKLFLGSKAYSTVVLNTIPHEGN